LSKTEVLSELATVIPDCELWLHKNDAAMASVQRGLRQMREGDFVDTPADITQDAKLAERLTDD